MKTPSTKTISPPASAEPGDSKFILYTTDDGRSRIALYADGGSVWLNQAQLAELFDTSRPNIAMHISNILKEGELFNLSVCKEFLQTAADGKNYRVEFYSLPMILAIGFRVRSVRGTQFRVWANQHLAEYLVKGFVIDDERLKNPDGRPDYFDELLAQIRDIRALKKAQDLALLTGGGSVSNQTMEDSVRQTYETFDARRKAADARAADDADLKALEQSVGNRKK